MFKAIVISCVILMINAGEDNCIKKQLIRNFSDDFVNFSPYYDLNNISAGDENAWDSLIFHSFVTSQEQNYEILSPKKNEIESGLTRCHTVNSLETDKDPRTSNEQKNKNDVQGEMETGENLEALNASELHVLCPSDVDEVLINMQSTKSAVFNNHDHEKIKIVSNVDSLLKKDFRERRNIVFEKCLKKTKLQIKEFMTRNMAKGHIDFYEKRLEIINRSFNNFNHNYIKLVEEHPFLTSRDHKLLASLNQLYFNFKKSEIFDQNTCNLFSSEFDYHFSGQTSVLPFDITLNLLEDFEQYHFYLEIMKLYKYISEIPELLTLSKLFSDKPYCDVPFVLHVINLFFDYIGNPKENRIFLLCLIYKAFFSSSRKFLDFFSFLNYTPFCSKEHRHMHIFLWEINPVKRKDMKKRLEEGKSLKCKLGDDDHFKIILTIYLYQYIEFLIFYGFDGDSIDYFCKYVTNSLNSKDCFACCFEEFLEITKKYSEAVK